MKELYEHQKKIINDNPLVAPLGLGTGSGKSRTCLELAEGKTLVVCLKQGRDDKTWEKNAEEFGIIINMKVISKEDFRSKYKTLGLCDTLIIDEAHKFLGVSQNTLIEKGEEIIQKSQLFDRMNWYIKTHKPKRIYLASATMISEPIKLYALSVLLGKNWDFFKFRQEFYVPIKKGWKTIWIKNKSKAKKQKLIDIFKKHLGAYVGQLSDWFDVPEQTHHTVHIELTKEQKEAIKFVNENITDPALARNKIRQIENGIMYTYELEDQKDNTEKMIKKTDVYKNNKIEYLIERAAEYPKMLIFADYTAQVMEITKALKKAGYDAVARIGKTKDGAMIFREAELVEERIVVVQARISEGYEFKTCPCVIFASKSNMYVDYEQGIGRVLRAGHLKKNLYIHLVVKGAYDEKCHENIMDGKDFQEMMMQK